MGNKRNKSSDEPKHRPKSKLPEGYEMWDLEAMADYVEAQNNNPLTRSINKYYEFVNQCVLDPDFKHPDSAVLLKLLVGIRDQLIDEMTEEWTMHDVLRPILQEYARKARDECGDTKEMQEAKNRGYDETEQKDKAIKEFLALGSPWGGRSRHAEKTSKSLKDNFGLTKSASGITKYWLSKAAINDYRARHKNSD